METWTQDEEGRWKRWGHPLLGVDAVASSSPRVVAFLVVGLGRPDDELLPAAIGLARRLADGPITVIAGSTHPCALWLQSVRRAGADRALFLSSVGTRRCDDPPLDGAVELGEGICPALHARDAQKTALSVCGRHRDRMILARHHFDRWCLAAKDECPSWRGTPRG
jgi:hypothetical protein